MNDQKNMILAIGLSALVLIGWQYFVGMPQMEKQKQDAQLRQQQTQTQTPGAPAQSGTAPGAPASRHAGRRAAAADRRRRRRARSPRRRPDSSSPAQAVLASSPRVAIETPTSKRLDLAQGRPHRRSGADQISRDRRSEIAADRAAVAVGQPASVLRRIRLGAGGGRQRETAGTRHGLDAAGIAARSAIDRPVTLTYDNGEGLEFRRIIKVDENYLFTIEDSVANKGAAPVSLYPYALISRHGKPEMLGYYILHEGLIGVMGDQGLQEICYSDIESKKTIPFKVTNAWLGITDKYWAATLLPDTKASLQARFSAGDLGNTQDLPDRLSARSGHDRARGHRQRRWRGCSPAPRKSRLVDAYDKKLELNRFELLIDWGWFYFITKPLFWLIDWLFKWLGNFGLAILAVTVHHQDRRSSRSPTNPTPRWRR